MKSCLPNRNSEEGFDAQLDLFRSLSVPKGTPADVKQKLTDAMVQAANSAPFQPGWSDSSVWTKSSP